MSKSSDYSENELISSLPLISAFSADSSLASAAMAHKWHAADIREPLAALSGINRAFCQI